MSNLSSDRDREFRRVRVFLASPGDVVEEREIARKVIDKLRNEWPICERVKLETIAWDQPGSSVPQEATLTPQAAIVKGLPKPSECDIVIAVFWSRMGTPIPVKWELKPNGQPYLSGTEWELLDAFNAARNNKGYPALWIYRRTEDVTFIASDPNREDKEKQWNLVETFFKSFEDSNGAITGGINLYEKPEDFERQFEDHLRRWIHHSLENRKLSNLQIDRSGMTGARWNKAPYPGLRAFTPDESAVFFGRELETGQLYNIVTDPHHRFLSIIGSSGSGKSSLVAAGLLPYLSTSDNTLSSDWVTLRLKPAEMGDNPFMALAAELAPKLETHGWRATQLAAQLKQTPSFIVDIAAQLNDTRSSAGDILLYIDQFEELFTMCNSSYQQPFVDLLANATIAPLRTVITVRADFYSDCLEIPELGRLVSENSYTLLAPAVSSLLDMIRRPAVLAGLELEQGLADRILTDTGGGPGQLALLAFTLRELYELGEANKRLTNADYDRLGGVRGAISRQAEKIFSLLKDNGVDVDSALEQVFRELIEIDEARGMATKKRAQIAKFAKSADALKLVKEFTDARLFVSTEEQIVEVTHEALFNSWPRLAKWIGDTRDDLRLLGQVKLAAAQWHSQGCGRPEFLWHKERLSAIQSMIKRLCPNLTDLEQLFAKSSWESQEVETLINKLEKPETKHYKRVTYGDRLAELGDSRNGVGLDEKGAPHIAWIFIPGGRILLEDNEDNFEVGPFYLAQYPITYRQYRAFVEAENGYSERRWWKEIYYENSPGKQERPTDNCPAENISWYDAIAFCRWLSFLLHYEVRLPAEWEWQLAATGGNPESVFSWGTKWDSNRTNTEESGLSRTTAVGMYPQSATRHGVLDMSGNVWEWCLNKYKNPRDTTTHGPDCRVIRGGSWYSDKVFAQSTFRNVLHPHERYNNLGFRVTCNYPQEQNT